MKREEMIPMEVIDGKSPSLDDEPEAPDDEKILQTKAAQSFSSKLEMIDEDYRRKSDGKKEK